MNLFLRSDAGKLDLCESVPYANEEELEKLVFENGEILGDVFPLWRQVRGGAKPGIPDIVGIDRDGAVCIVEVKNVTVDESILPQVLAYAIWAENNPDSIHKMWLEKADRPEDLSPDFDNYTVKIVVVAPAILPGTAHHMRKVTFDVTLLEVRRFQLGSQLAVSANRIEALPFPKTGTTKGLGTYDHAWYSDHSYDAKAISEYFRLIEEATEIAVREGWQLDVKLNKNYTSFKIGSSIAFGIEWATTKEFSIFFKLTAEQCEELLPPNGGKYKYDVGFKQGHMRLSQGKAGLADFVPLMERSVRRFSP